MHTLTPLTGAVLEDLTLSAGAYQIEGSFSVAEGVRLTLEPGVKLYGTQYQSDIVSAGDVVSIGTSTDPVEIHGIDIELVNSPASVFKNTVFTDYVVAINFNGSSKVDVDHCAFIGGYRAMTDYGGYTHYSVTNSTFMDHLSSLWSIRVSSTTPSVISRNEFINVDTVIDGGYFFGETVFEENNITGAELVITAPSVGYGHGTISAPSNWWGVTTEAEIQTLIYDRFDLATLSEVNYENFKLSAISEVGSALESTSEIVNWGRGIPVKTVNSQALSVYNVKTVEVTSAEENYAHNRFFPTHTQILSAELEETTDGAVDISDVVIQLRHIVGLSELIGLNKVAADNDSNGSVNISDVVSSLRQIVGLEDAPNARIVDKDGNYQFTFDDSVTELFVVAAGDSDLSWVPAELM